MKTNYRPLKEDDSNLPIRDIEHALRVVGGSQTLVDQMFSALQKELPQQRNSMQEYIANGNWEALWNIAHRIHGSTAICGVPALNQSVAKLEDIIKIGTPEERLYYMEQVFYEIDRVLLTED